MLTAAELEACAPFVVRVINARTGTIVEEARGLTEREARRTAESEANRLAADYADDDAWADRAFPFVPDVLMCVDPYTIEVRERTDAGLRWRYQVEVTDGWVAPPAGQ